MSRFTRIVALLLVFCFITGFSSRFAIVVEDVTLEHLYFKLEKKNFLTKINSTVELNNFSVVEKIRGKWDYKNPLWAFELKPGSALEVSKFKYGETPHGFSETVKAKQLVSGTPYLAMGSGLGSTGSIEFVVK
ncbi:hypothetical protein [Collimonas humicola]|uniref:hypothetical protein n=1 Tax=Collimonas humicola TaxID=2825886 RepID=UPI001B8C29A3|nr:hypothetical protein [Collimonas humicola]